MIKWLHKIKIFYEMAASGKNLFLWTNLRFRLSKKIEIIKKLNLKNIFANVMRKFQIDRSNRFGEISLTDSENSV